MVCGMASTISCASRSDDLSPSIHRMLRLAYLIAMSGGWALRVYDERHKEGAEASQSNRATGSATSSDVAATARCERHRKSRSAYHSLLSPPTSACSDRS